MQLFFCRSILAACTLVLTFTTPPTFVSPWQERLVNFFEAVCSVNGAPERANQEMTLRLLWRADEDRRALFVEVSQCAVDHSVLGTPAQSPL